jgi:hypothetical protein
VDVFDATTLRRLGGQNPAGVRADASGLGAVAWSPDGQTLFAAGAVADADEQRLLFAWDRGGFGRERRLTYCAPDTALNINALPQGRILVASMASCLGLMDAQGKPIWTVGSPVLDFRDQSDIMKLSLDGKVVDFGYRGSVGAVLRFDTRSLTLSSPPPNDDTTFAPNRDGLTIEDWRDGTTPTLEGRAIPIRQYDIARSLAIAQDAKRVFLGSMFALTAFDNLGAEKWRRTNRGETWVVNASKDGRVVVAASGGGTIRWHRADDGSELLALQVLPNQKDWVLWTPEGFLRGDIGRSRDAEMGG